MSAKRKGGNVVATVWEIAQPIANELGYEIWDIRFLKEGADWFLRFFIDKPDGISIDDCADFSRAVDKLIDDADPIEQAYYLEVSSPGIERDLVREEHFKLMMGRPIKVKFIRPIENQRDFNGILTAYDGGEVTIVLNDESEMTFNKKDASWIKLDDFGGFGE